jgi:p-aminobenzoyl-glutamate transporter AbgT
MCDIVLAVRGAVVFMVPFLVGLALGAPQDAVFAAFAAHSRALVDVDGPYVLWLPLLCLMAAAFAASAGLGSLAAGSLPAAMAAKALLGLIVGAWRQLGRDYGGLRIARREQFPVTPGAFCAQAPCRHLDAARP